MLAVTGGQERSDAEFDALLYKSGFRLTRVIHTESPMTVIIEAVSV